MRVLGILDWAGLDWPGLDWPGLAWAGLDWTGRRAPKPGGCRRRPAADPVLRGGPLRRGPGAADPRHRPAPGPAGGHHDQGPRPLTPAPAARRTRRAAAGPGSAPQRLLARVVRVDRLAGPPCHVRNPQWPALRRVPRRRPPPPSAPTCTSLLIITTRLHAPAFSRSTDVFGNAPSFLCTGTPSF